MSEPTVARALKLYRGLRVSPHKVMELACSRLGLSRLRMRAEDALLDAAIGLEALLLPGVSTELGYRFRLHYALLGSAPSQRVKRWEKAKVVYEIRSKVAHGAAVGRKELSEAAEFSQAMLHECIEKFEDDMVRPLCTRDEYWRNLVLGTIGVDPPESDQ